MGTFRGHLFPGLGITLFGLWHIFNTIKAYKHKNSKRPTSKYTWFPITIHSLPWLKPLELHLLLAFTIITMSFTLHAYTITLELDNLEHTAMLFFVTIYAASGIIVDLHGFSDELSGLVGLLLASAFANELFLVHCHSSDHVGLEGHYHWLLELILVVSLVTTINTSLSSSENNYVSAIIRSMSIMAQGLWLMVMGFALYFPKFTPEGCYEGRTNQAVACGTEATEKRAAGMANLEFSLMVVGVNVLVLMVSLWEWRGHGCVGYKRIQRAVIDEREVHEETKQLQP
ncbi:hypothetical protein J5N97_009450 [Dioscorea zingiberensis]|uniref:Transmembrane protein 45B n=1 Tax=Dioscorea zingiberensis TaxID=325984 RepID=A0A9D5HLH5_9LILI|nr:hypothetical protein J5N97_009450 [Dioscorea zingiberensis]